VTKKNFIAIYPATLPVRVRHCIVTVPVHMWPERAATPYRRSATVSSQYQYTCGQNARQLRTVVQLQTGQQFYNSITVITVNLRDPTQNNQNDQFTL